MEQSHRSNMRSLSVDFTHGGRLTGFDLASTDVRSWLQQWPRVLSQLETLVVGLKRRYGCGSARLIAVGGVVTTITARACLCCGCGCGCGVLS